MQALRGLSTGPLSRPFHPRCVGGSSDVLGLMLVSFKLGLIFVTVGVGFVYVSSVMVGSFPHWMPTGIKLFQRSLLFSAPLYWNVPKSHPDGARLSFTAMSIWINVAVFSDRCVFS